MVGFASGDPTSGLLDLLYVDPAGWGGGAGRMLLERSSEALGAAGCTPRLWAWTGNARAEAFYARAGWRPGTPVRHAQVAGQQFEYRRWDSPARTQTPKRWA